VKHGATYYKDEPTKSQFQL